MKRRNFFASGLLAGISISNSYVFASTHELIGNDKKPLDPLDPFYIPPSPEPLKVGPTGGDFRVKVRSTQTNMQYSCIEGLIGPKIMGPAPHIHKELDEVMFVQEGTVSVLVGEKVYEVEAGGWHLRPHGIVHTFWNATDKAAVYIDMFFNQDFENFLEEMFLRLIPDFIKRGIPLTSIEATQKMNKLNLHYGITMFNEQRQPIMDKYGLK